MKEALFELSGFFREFHYFGRILIYPTMQRFFFFLPCYLLIFKVSAAQSGLAASYITGQDLPVITDSVPDKIYHVKLKYELPASAAFLTGSYFGFSELDKVAAFTESDLQKLNPDNINGFDRPVINMNPAGFQSAHERSNLFLNASILSPLILALDKDIRKDWLDLITLYLVAHAVDNTVYFATTFPVRRARPLTYNTNLSVKERTGVGKSNSFFSGHVSFSSTATFFLVKVYTDYHHIKGWKRLLLYGAASVPPSLVGYYRMRAGRHFKTDVLTGFVIGAASGILVPELHRNKGKDKRLSVAPFYTPLSSGVTLTFSLN